MPDDTKPKIIIDSDWKSQAQAEKDKMAAEEAKKAASKPTAAAGGAGGRGGPREMPAADFQSLMGTLVTQALLYMGGFPDPKTGRAMVSMDYARFHIDLLAVLEAKTKNNLTPEESAEITQVLNELRMRYVELGKAIEEMAKEQAAGGGPGGLGGMGGGLGGQVLGGPSGGPVGGGPGKLVF